MRLEQSFIEQVRSSTSIVDLISNYVGLKKSGQNYQGLCPFHSEKTPSFMVSEIKQIFKCFGCGAGGDIFKFVTLMDGLSFPEAVEQLATQNGIPLPASEPGESQARENRFRLLDISREADRYFQACLGQTEGAAARQYLDKRSIDEATIASFGLGFAPAGNGLLRFLTGKGVSRSEAASCGLIKESETGDYYDRFRSRVIFPIRNLSGHTIAFGGRILGEGQPKYLNSPETPLYNKSSNLYGLDVAREEIRQRDFVILVEGYFDCIVPHQFGFRNTVASLGTSLTPIQVKILSRYTRNVIINFDPDSAGMAAAMRSIELFLTDGFRVNVVQLPSGEDPDSFLCREGAEAYQGKLTSSEPYLDFSLARFISEHKDPTSPKAKQDIVNQILPYLARFPHRIERSEYISRIANRLQVDEKLIMLEMRRMVRGKTEGTKPLSLHLALPELTWSEQTLLRAVLEPQKEAMLSLLDAELFEGLRSKAIFEKVLQLRELKREISILRLRDLLEDEEDLHLLETLSFGPSDASVSEADLHHSILALRKKQDERLSRQIQEEIRCEEESNRKSSRLEELLVKKEEIRRRMELDLP